MPETRATYRKVCRCVRDTWVEAAWWLGLSVYMAAIALLIAYRDSL